MQPGLLLNWERIKIQQGAWLWFIAVFLLLILVKFAGISVNGANRWIMLGPMSLQPSELAKVAGIIWTAAFFGETDQE